ncbi:alpha-2-macroglobulin family protein [Candidatus Poriferisocius sp.]|uniref:alpha-2-macroglobulin family protein n=1 Tax=Candidatus Poriferisocius sp. TaxID=3101276 RepID=UPI003B01365B
MELSRMLCRPSSHGDLPPDLEAWEMMMNYLRRLAVVGLAFVLLAAVCSCEGEPAEGEGSGTASGAAIRVVGGEDPDQAPSLRVRLSQGGTTPGEGFPEMARVDGEPLDEAEIRGVTDRLSPWDDGEGGDGGVEFNRPPESLPPPRTGATIEHPFPAGLDSQASPVDQGPLEVLRVQPTGMVGIAPFVSITFNQPMVPLATLGQLDALDVPVAITPTLPGRWQWIGTRTLRFEHDPEILDRLPMATSYAVEIPAGTKSQAGGELVDDARFTFETPPPTLLELSPRHDSLGLQPVFLATFDQRIKPAAALEAITLTASGQERGIRLATAVEIEADEAVTRRIDSAVEGTWLAFRPAAPLDADSEVEIEVGPHVPSAEGSNTSSEPSIVSARTYGPLRIDVASCQPTTYQCYPGHGLSIQFNNTLNPDTLHAADFSITPRLPDATISVSGRRLQIRGTTADNTVYEVVVPGTLGDEFGQTLKEPQTIEFTIEEARPLIRSQGGEFATIDPLGTRQTLPILVRRWEQLRVRLYRVEPNEYGPFQRFLTHWNRNSNLNLYASDPSHPSLPKAPWPLAVDEIIDTGIDHGDLVEVPIDLSRVLRGRHGHVVAMVEGAGEQLETANLSWESRPVVMWVQDTDIGVDLISHQDDLVVWATDLSSGDPLPGAEISFSGLAGKFATDEGGLARTTAGSAHIDLVAARRGEDAALLPVYLRPETQRDQTIWYTADDRGIYRPGETLNLKGWVRNLDLSGDGGLELFSEGELIAYEVYDPFGNELDSGVARLDKLGGFNLTVELSEQANLGQAWIQFHRRAAGDEGWHDHRFQIQEFRRPEFEVATRTVASGPYFVDEPAEVAVEAKYFSGGPLPNAEVTWTVTTHQATYSPPRWSDFTFGVWLPWWYGGGFRPGDHWSAPERKTLAGTTGADGSHIVRIDFEGDGDQLPSMVTAQAEVLDVNRQQWSSSTDLLVHSARLYVGLRSDRAFVKAGDGLEIEAVVTDLDGNAVPGRPVGITVGRIVDQFTDGEWVEVAVDEEACQATSARAPVSCEFAASTGGRYRIDARVADDSGQISRSELTRWVSGGRDGAPRRNIELEVADLIPDSEAYESGDDAEILVVSPFKSATGLLTIAHSRIIETRTFEVAEHSAVLTVPITDDHVPELTVQVELVSVTERTAADGTVIDGAPARPAIAAGQVTLRVPPAKRTLDVAATPASDVAEPGSTMSIEVEVRDANGAPVEGADVLLVVVDEAVLAVSGYELIDPIDVFYSPWGVYLNTFRSRSEILLENVIAQSADGEEQTRLMPVAEAGEPTAAESASADEAMADGDFGRADPTGTQIDVRQNLDALALFDPKAVTDDRGRVGVEFDLPDSLTRYRVMAVAVADAERFGSAESAITARLPLQVRPSAPRFLNFGDEFELPIVVQNQTDAAMEVDVVVQVSNLQLTGSPGRRIEVPANDRVEVRFPARTISPGVARLRAAAVSGDHADAQVVALPVYTPATSEAFATYGVVDQGAVFQPIAAPTDVIPQFGGLEINTSSTALQALTDAVLYLTQYRYTSSDAYASRILAISALRDVLGAFEAEGLGSPGELDAVVRRDIAQLESLQIYDGGFGWWSRREGAYPYPSIQAMHALLTARENGFAVSGDVIESGLGYLRNINARISDDYGQRAKDMLAAYALHVRGLAADRSTSPAARTLWNRRGADLGLDAMALIWPLVDDDDIEAEIGRVINNRATETARAATFATDYGEDAHLILHSDRRTDGIVLDALIAMAPESDLIPKVVAGLLGNQVKGRWNNVQENSFILLALNRYFAAFEASDPDFVARVWLGDLYAAQHEFAGRSTDRALTLVPMGELLEAGDSNLIVEKDGEGRLYYRLGLRYAPDDLNLDALDRGFVVQRSYEAIDDPGDVWLDDDGVWHVLAGAKVRVYLTMVNDSRRTNMALVDPMPAGFESLNPALAPTGEIGVRRGGAEDSWWRWTWYEHQNLRDDRAEAFSSYLWAGVHEYSYVARATTPGTFVVPPAKAEEIYAPEVFGRSRTDTVVVQDPR